MVKVKPIDVVVKKWQSRASVASEDYKAGVENPKQDWATAAKSSEGTWKAAMSAAMAKGSWGKGIDRAGTEKWRTKALAVGASRYAPGVAAAVDEYNAKMSKVLNVISGVSLSARGPRGDPKNYDRVKQIGDSLHKAKEAGAF